MSLPQLHMSSSLCFLVYMALKQLYAWFQSYEREAHARQLEVAESRKTGETHRRRVKTLEQEVASQRILAKVCSETTWHAIS